MAANQKGKRPKAPGEKGDKRGALQARRPRVRLLGGEERGQELRILSPEPVAFNGAARQRYKRRRFFGPFLSGSDLSQVCVSVTAANAAWTFGSYFDPDSNDALDLYRLAWGGGDLPVDDGVVPACIPGSQPADGNVALTFSLFRVAYVERYGGSLQLAFRALETTGYELRIGNRLWDLSALELLVYVSPRPDVFNDLASVLDASAVSCEFAYGGIVTYELVPPVLPAMAAVPQALAQPDLDGASNQLRAIARTLMTAGALEPAKRFAAGFLLSLFPDFLNAGRRVDGVCIGQGAISFHVHEPVPQIVVSIAVSAGYLHGAWPDLDVPPYTFSLTILRQLLLSDGTTVDLGGYTLSVGRSDENTTHWTPDLPIGHWTAAEFDTNVHVDAIILNISGSEIDAVTSDDRLAPVSLQIPLPRGQIDAALAADEAGPLPPGTLVFSVETPFAGGSEDPTNPVIAIHVALKMEIVDV